MRLGASGRRGLGAVGKGAMRLGGDGVRISRKEHRAGKGCVRDGRVFWLMRTLNSNSECAEWSLSPRRVEARSHTGRGAETPRTVLASSLVSSPAQCRRERTCGRCATEKLSHGGGRRPCRTFNPGDPLP